MRSDFANRTLLLTGASGGIGQATARAFLARGANLVLLDWDDLALTRLEQDLGPDADGKILAIRNDASKAADAKTACEAAANRFGGIDFVVTSAGIYRDEPASAMSEQQWRQTLAINLDGVFFIASAALPFLRDNSAIVNLTSMAAHCGGSFGHAHYGASKGGVLALTRSLAREWGPKTRVNAVSPGVIETPMTTGILADRGASVLAQTPLQRFGQPTEIASVIAFLCSDDASFITGEAIHVNGGIYMGG